MCDLLGAEPLADAMMTDAKGIRDSRYLGRMASDPRLASAMIAGGPDDGHELTILVPVTVGGAPLFIPKLLPGVAEYVTVAHAEAEANRLHHGLLDGADALERIHYEGREVPYQPNAIDFVVTGGTVVMAAATGLEAFANHHVATYCAPQSYDGDGTPVGPAQTVELLGETLTFRDLANKPVNERLGRYLPELRGIATPPTSETWWAKLRQIQALAALNRHGITDPVERRGLVGVKSLVQRLCEREYAGTAAMMLAAFEFISPGWIDAQRAVDLPPAPENV
jgi:hypothetical protein